MPEFFFAFVRRPSFQFGLGFANFSNIDFFCISNAHYIHWRSNCYCSAVLSLIFKEKISCRTHLFYRYYCVLRGEVSKYRDSTIESRHVKDYIMKEREREERERERERMVVRGRGKRVRRGEEREERRVVSGLVRGRERTEKWGKDRRREIFNCMQAGTFSLFF